MTTLMVWNYQVDQTTEDGYTWVKVPTNYKVGSRQELLFWRVMNATGGTSKEYFYSPQDYESFSGVPMSEYQEQTNAWHIQHKDALQEFAIKSTNTNATIVSNGRTFASFFSTEQPTGSTVS